MGDECAHKHEIHKSTEKTRDVESVGTGRKFIYLTRGDLWSESTGEVSRSRSSEDIHGKMEGAKDRRTTERVTKSQP